MRLPTIIVSRPMLRMKFRTPLTIIRGELEQAIQEPGLSNTVVDAIGSALEEIDRMSQIVQSLMATAYLDSGGEQMERRPIDIGHLTGSTIEQMRLLAEERNITLIAEQLEPLIVEAHPTRLKQVIVNLIDNAMKYNQPGGTVTVSIVAQGNKALLRELTPALGFPRPPFLIFLIGFTAPTKRARVPPAALASALPL